MNGLLLSHNLIASEAPLDKIVGILMEILGVLPVLGQLSRE